MFFPEGQTPSTRVTVVIAARNEEAGIHRTIEDILAQNYPQDLLELIVANDHSTDNTAAIIGSYADKGVVLINLNEDQLLNSYKKKALTEAITLAKGDLIIATDADCRMGKDWVRTIVSYYEGNDVKLISSPVAYFEEKNAFEELQTLEFSCLIGLGASCIGNGIPWTCNGANLAYSRAVFNELGGFKGIDDVASGDDELFLSKVAKRYPKGIGFCKAREAIVFTHAKYSLKDFINQRKRWASKAIKHKDPGIAFLGIAIWLFNAITLLNILLGFLDYHYLHIAAFMLVLKFTAELSFFLPISRFMQRGKLLLYLPFLCVVHVIYMVFIGIAGNSGKYVWKGRLVR